MSAHPYPPVRRIVRDSDYYGGDLSVDLEWDEDRAARTLEIRWAAWGGHGATKLAIANVTEARQLAAALTFLADVLEAENDGWLT